MKRMKWFPDSKTFESHTVNHDCFAQGLALHGFHTPSPLSLKCKQKKLAGETGLDVNAKKVEWFCGSNCV